MKHYFSLICLFVVICLSCSQDDPAKSPAPEPLKTLNAFGIALTKVEKITNKFESLRRAFLADELNVFGVCADVVTGTDEGFTTYTLTFGNTACADAGFATGSWKLL